MVFSTRSLSWSRELAITSLVASSRKRRKSPFGNLLVLRTPARAAFSTQPTFCGGEVMSPRSGKEFRTSPADLTITHRHAAGIDVHSREHFVAVAAEDVPAGFVNPDGKLPTGVRKFGANTGDLE